MKKSIIRKKTLLELIKSSRIIVKMDTSQKIIKPKKGKGNYRRHDKHKGSVD